MPAPSTPTPTLRKTIAYDRDVRAWAVRIQHGLVRVQVGGYATPEEASAVGDALVALLCALGRPPAPAAMAAPASGR